MAERFTKLLTKIPMVMVVIPFATGIFFAEYIALPLWLICSLCIIALAGVFLFTKWRQNTALFALIFAVGVLLHSLSYKNDIPYNKPLDILLKVKTSSVERKGYTSAEATIAECEASSLLGRNITLWGDSLTRFKAGDRVRLSTPIRPFNDKHEEYVRLMYHRGFVGSVSVNHLSTYEYIPATTESLHDWAVRRLRSALEPSDARAVVLAMTTGERCEIDNELRQQYSKSGASHLLAVSGLHIGIAFMLINLLLLPLIMLRYGNVIRSVVAVALIWGFVALCGLSPSAVRAAIMFSLLQISLSSAREYAGVNILTGTAFVMLAFNPHLLFDISFQLSFIAVAGIILWAIPLYRACATRSKAINILLGTLLVGLISTLVTMPLVSHTFGVISLVGIAINPVVILLANIIVLAGIISLALPFMGAVAEIAAEWQNKVVEWAASLPYGHFDIRIAESTMWCLYALFIGATLLFLLLPKREKEIKIEG